MQFSQIKKLVLILILALIAFGNATYLTMRWFELRWQEQIMGFSFCDISDSLSCSRVLTHPAAWIADMIPFPAVAMVVYPIIVMLAILGLTGKIARPFHILLPLAIGWLCFNGYFIFQETFIIQAFCPLCIMCTAIIITIGITSLFWWRWDCKRK